MKNEYGVKLDKNGYAPSIIQEDESRCWLCGEGGDNLNRHEVFGGAFREKSKRLGLWVNLHHSPCHVYGEHEVHQDPEKNRALKAAAQRAAMEAYGWSIEDFRFEFGKNYID